MRSLLGTINQDAANWGCEIQAAAASLWGDGLVLAQHALGDWCGSRGLDPTSQGAAGLEACKWSPLSTCCTSGVLVEGL